MSREEENILDEYLLHDLCYWIGLTDMATEGTDKKRNVQGLDISLI